MAKEIAIFENGDFEIKSKKFRNIKTGEIVTQFSILDIANFEEVN